MALPPINSTQPDLGPSWPSAEEQDAYYYGLPSKPKLVARSSKNSWNFQQDHWPIGKVLGVVGRHMIADLWNDSAHPLRRDIFEALNGIQWTTIDILRIGYERMNDFTGEEFEHPVTFFISVENDSTEWSQAHEAVSQCHKILQRYGIHDVHVEMKEAHVIRNVTFSSAARSATPSQSEPRPTAASPREAPSTAVKLSSDFDGCLPQGGSISFDGRYRAAWSENLGLSISTFGEPEREGTKCLYLRQKDSGAVFVLTCRNVIFGETEPNVEFKDNGSNAKRITIIQAGATTFKKVQEELPMKFELAEAGIQWHEDSNDEATRVQQEALTALHKIKSIMSSTEDPATRIIGHVVYSPKLGMDISGQRLRDWALIELHPGKHTTALELLKNKVIVGDANIAKKKMKEALGMDSHVLRKFVFDLTTHTAQLEGVIPEQEMKYPPEESRALDEPAFLVAKYGSGSRFSIGFANNVMSVTRQLTEDLVCYAEEWCIIGQDRRENFSVGDDSGSCVWDAQGRIGGMLTSGTGNSTNGTFDVSYATPMEWLLKDIKDHGYDVEVLGEGIAAYGCYKK